MTSHSDQMRILTVRQPWAWAIIHGGKDVENRVRNVAGSYRGPVAIHAGLDFAADGANEQVWGAWLRTKDPLDKGAIIGVVDLVDVHRSNRTANGTLIDWAEETPVGQVCSRWAEDEAYHLVLANPRALDGPIPYKGALGLRNLDDDTTARILAQIGAS